MVVGFLGVVEVGRLVVDVGRFAGLVAGLLDGRPVLPPIIPPPVTPFGSCCANAALVRNRTRIADRLVNRGRNGVDIIVSPAANTEWAADKPHEAL